MKTTLRILTCGSVDDGKSTLIGRLLIDSGLVKQDQYKDAYKKAVEAAEGKEDHLMAYLCDGLLEEREKGITIDVAHRYFETERHKYIINDCPGHAEFQQNMATGCSVSDIAIILIDSSRGAENCITSQTTAHFHTVGIFAIPEIIVCVNKLDVYKDPAERCSVYKQVMEKANEVINAHACVPAHVQFVPISALEGSNVVKPAAEDFVSDYEGNPLFSILEELDPPRKPHADYLGCFQIERAIPQKDSGIVAIWGKQLTGSFIKDQGTFCMESDQEPVISKITIGEQEVPCTETGKSYCLFAEADAEKLEPGMVLLQHHARFDKAQTVPWLWEDHRLVECIFTWLSDTSKGVGDKVRLKLHGRIVEAEINATGVDDVGLNVSVKKGNTGTITFNKKGGNVALAPYYPFRNLMGAITIIDPDTYESLGAAMALAINT